MSAISQQKLEVVTPMPLTHFKRFLTVFHVIFLCGLAFSLILRWRRPGLVWAWQDTVLVVLVAVQVGLYLLFLVVLWKPPTATGWWVAYFSVSLGIWLSEWQIESGLQWTAWAYLGQMFGVLRPAISVPGALVVFVTFFDLKFGTKGLTVWDWIGAGSLAVSTIALGLFLHAITTTSSERARLIQQLEAAQKQLELSRERETELAALQERERLARELHDSLGHGLVTLTVQLEAAQRLYAVDPAKASALMEEMKHLTRTSMDQLRRSLSGLRTPGLGERPLGPALDALCNENSRPGEFDARCSVTGNTESLTPSVEEALWRVAQEGLRNAAHHARARTVLVELQIDPSEAMLSVADNGVGLPATAEEKPGHFGLRGLRERVEGLGGTFKADTNPGGGTRLEARIPIVSV